MQLTEVSEPGALTALAGTGGPEFFRVLNVAGWPKDWSASDPEFGVAAVALANAAPNPVLVLDLAAAADGETVEAACAAFGAVREVFRPKGAPFAVVQFKEDGDAAKCVAGLASVAGAPVRTQPGKQGAAEVTAWRQTVHLK